MKWPLLQFLPDYSEYSESLILERFLNYTQLKKIQLYGPQEESILEIFSGRNVILNTPTGSGKSLVALSLHFDSLAQGRRSYYTSPIKALVNEKFFALCRDFGPDQVGMITGDATVNPKAPIICCTAEILAQEALREGDLANIQDVVMDEFHYYSDRERGVAWQIPLLTLKKTRFLLMSATMGETEKFEKVLTGLNGRPTSIIKSTERPVPLEFEYSENLLHETVAHLIERGRAPIYIVNFTQRECASEAQNFMSVDLCTKEEKQKINEALKGFKFSSPYGKEVQKFLKHGMGIHHGGLLPKYRVLVEKLAQRGLLKIIFGTDTLGVGVNVPLRTVLFTKLCKYDGQKTVILSVRDFQQISGRAGRKGFDDLGTVVVQAPEHVIENKRNELKASVDPKKLKKLVKKQPPEKGFVMWNQDTFNRLVNGEAEALVSRFQVSQSQLLLMLSRTTEDGCRAMQKLIHDCHETGAIKQKLRSKAFQYFRALVDRQIILLNPLRVNVDLQEDFSLNHALSLYLVDTLKLLDPQAPDYAFDVITLAESILEDPELVLRKHLDRLKSARMAELKAEGVEFEARIEELEKLEHPKPKREFIYQTFNEFSQMHPWLVEENIKPKSVAREMIEGFYAFTEYIREYDLQRAEGVLLRYLSDVYKVLVQNIPEQNKNSILTEIIIYFETMIRSIDSSLLDEWEELKDPSLLKTALQNTEVASAEIVHKKWNVQNFRVMVRNEVFKFVKLISRKMWADAVEILLVTIDEDSAQQNREELSKSWIQKLEKWMKDLESKGYGQIRTDAESRGPECFQLREESKDQWLVHQVLLDANEHNDCILEFSVDINASQKIYHPVLKLNL